jgi:hypothetical protein
LLKIDLLPSYVRERRKVKPAMFLVLVILVVEIVALLGFAASIKKQTAAVEAETAKVQPDAEKAKQLQAEADAKLASRPTARRCRSRR